ncbi:MAG TPA: HupE/UreJ family protein [Burkholderiaceae bacterium]|jgi:hypothetical protein
MHCAHTHQVGTLAAGNCVAIDCGVAWTRHAFPGVEQPSRAFHAASRSCGRLVAGEALHGRPTLSRRWPALLAFLFGLVHGLGFAGALKEIGLPQHDLGAALLTFNVGVELGQLAVVGVAWLAYRIVTRWPQTAWARAPALYAIGSVAAYWSWQRLVGMLA